MKAREQIHQTNTAYKHVFESPDGKIVLKDLEAIFGVTHTGKDATPTSVTVSAGQLNVLNYIQQRIQHAVS